NTNFNHKTHKTYKMPRRRADDTTKNSMLKKTLITNNANGSGGCGGYSNDTKVCKESYCL
ncbi:MAG: hypothetical protein J6T46_06790, partial [Victivallales bacterium]|nr:hypothetical protein [Victivallales bacterium]